MDRTTLRIKEQVLECIHYHNERANVMQLLELQRMLLHLANRCLDHALGSDEEI